MYSNHSCKNFIPILTPDAEHVCSKCGIVLEEKVEMYVPVRQVSSIQICDENRHGSENISPDCFNGEGKKSLNTTNKKILSARQKPQRMLFTNTCTVLGLGPDYTRTALFYYDMIHGIRSKLKQNISQTDSFSKIVAALQKSKTMTEANVIQSMISSKYWANPNIAKEWIKGMIGDNSFENISKIKKPKKLSTLNIAFFSIYQVVCDNNVRINREQIVTAIKQHMKFTRKIKMTSALTVCKTILSLEKKRQLETPVLQHDILLESVNLPSEKSKRTFYRLTPLITSKKNAKKLKQQLEIMS